MLKLEIFLLYFFVFALLVIFFVLSLEVGSANVSFLGYFFSSVPKDDTIVNILNIRLLQSFSVLISGFCLSLSGFLLQRVLRNYLVDPGITGVLSGSALGVTVFSILGFSLFYFSLVRYFFSFLFGLIAGAILIIFSMKFSDTLRVVVFGVIVNSFLSGLIVLLQSISNPYELHNTFLFLSGSIGYIGWDMVIFDIVTSFLVLLSLLFFSKNLDIISFGDVDAHVLGVSVKLWRSVFLTFAVLLSSISVSLTGVIGFIGFIVPNIVNLISYNYHFLNTKHGLVLSSVLGSMFLLVCFIFSKLVVSPYELPLGVITGLVGAPIFGGIITRISK